jgi:hypothetical protein
MEEIVNMQLVGYNSKNIFLFSSAFDDNIKIFEHSNNLIIDGKKQLIDFFTNRFKISSNLDCKILNRIVLDNKIIDHEYVTGIFDHPIELIVMHTIENNKIKRVDYLAKFGYPK